MQVRGAFFLWSFRWHSAMVESKWIREIERWNHSGTQAVEADPLCWSSERRSGSAGGQVGVGDLRRRGGSSLGNIVRRECFGGAPRLNSNDWVGREVNDVFFDVLRFLSAEPPLVWA